MIPEWAGPICQRFERVSDVLACPLVYRPAFRGRFQGHVYQRKRLHSALSSLMPAECETQWRRQTAAASVKSGTLYTIRPLGVITADLAQGDWGQKVAETCKGIGGKSKLMGKLSEKNLLLPMEDTEIWGERYG